MSLPPLTCRDELEREITAHPRALAFYLEKAALVDGIDNTIHTLERAKEALPRSLLLCAKMLRTLAASGNASLLLGEAARCDEVLAGLERSGLIEPRQVGVVLGHFASSLLEDPMPSSSIWRRGGVRVGLLEIGGTEGVELMHKIVAWLEEAVGRDAFDPHALYHLANARMRIGEMDVAERLLHRLLELKPQHDEARNGLIAVRQLVAAEAEPSQATRWLPTAAMGVMLALFVTIFASTLWSTSAEGSRRACPWEGLPCMQTPCPWPVGGSSSEPCACRCAGCLNAGRHWHWEAPAAVR